MKKSELRQLIREGISKVLKESVNEGVRIPSNIEDFAKRKGVLRDVKQIARWVEKAGKRIVGGGATGKGADTLVLDLTYQGAEIYYDTDRGTIQVNRQPVTDLKSMLDAIALKESVNEGEYRIGYEDEDDNRHYIKIKASSEEEAEEISYGLDGFRTLKSIELVNENTIKGTHSGRPVVINKKDRDMSKWTVTFTKTKKTVPIADVIANLKDDEGESIKL